MRISTVLAASLGVSLSVAAHAQGVSVLGQAGSQVSSLKFSVIAQQSAGFNRPADLAFNPVKPNDLYVVNQGEFSSVLLSFDDSKAVNSSVVSQVLKTAPGAYHFMPLPSGIAFADNGWFATIHDIDTPTQPTTPGDFMGPTLWTSTRYDGGHPTHMDMLHNTPSGLGIAWIHGNAYVVNDGYHGSITVYDFRTDHGPGMHDHSDGVILRYADGLLKRGEGLPAGVAYDKESGIAYAVDTGNNRIVSIDLGLGYASASGLDYITLKNPSYKVDRVLGPDYDGGISRFVDGPQLQTVVEGSEVGLTTPTGLALHDGILYVSDFTNAEILAFSKTGELLDRLSIADIAPAVKIGGLGGIEFDSVGRLYVTDIVGNAIYRVENLSSK